MFIPGVVIVKTNVEIFPCRRVLFHDTMFLTFSFSMHCRFLENLTDFADETLKSILDPENVWMGVV